MASGDPGAVQLGVKAVAPHMDVGVALRQIALGVWPDLPGILTVFDEHDRLRCDENDPLHVNFRWNRDTVTVFGLTLSAIVLTAKFG